MNRADVEGFGSVETAELRRALDECLGPRRVRALQRRASLYATSQPLEELTLTLDDGGRLELMFKNVDPRALPTLARAAKPPFLDNPLREIELYRCVLDPVEMGTPVCHGVSVDEAAGRYWLFLEKVVGRELYQVGEFEVWKRAARSLAELHRRLAQVYSRAAATGHLIEYDADYFLRWLERALDFGASADRLALRRLAEPYRQVASELTALPRRLIHGEFYASNVIIQERALGIRVCPVDWERAALGPALVDLAALTSGKWRESQKTELAEAYYAALGQTDKTQWNDFLRAWRLCRLHLAVQWLGWSAEWSPPPDHCQNWLHEAVQVAEQLGNSVALKS